MIASSTNVWGTDPGDPGHYYGLANLFPFPAFSNALAEQITGVVAVLLPINSGCDDTGCPNGNALVAGWYQPGRIWTLLTTGKFTFDDNPVVYPMAQHIRPKASLIPGVPSPGEPNTTTPNGIRRRTRTPASP